MIKDKLGNIIKPGQYASCVVLEHNIICRVVEVREPTALSIPNAPSVGEVLLVSEHRIPVIHDPRNPSPDDVMPLTVCQVPPDFDKPKGHA